MLKACLIALFAVAMASAAFAGPPHFRTGGGNSGWSQATCLKNVEKVLRSLEFSKDLDVDSDDAEAHNGLYSAETSCSRSGYAFVIVAGPDFKKAGELRDAIGLSLKALQ